MRGADHRVSDDEERNVWMFGFDAVDMLNDVVAVFAAVRNLFAISVAMTVTHW